MNKKLTFIFIIITLLMIFCAKEYIKEYDNVYAFKKKHITFIHNRKLIDYYYWLRDRDNEKVIEYINRENDFTQKVSAQWKDIEDTLYNEFLSRIKQTDLSVPYRMGNYVYYYKTIEGKQYSIFCRKDKNNKEQILIDENILGEKYDYFYIDDIKISPSENLIAFTVDTTGNEVYTLMIKDVDDNKINTLDINGISSIEWGENDSIIYYTKENNSKRPFLIIKHNIIKGILDTLFVDNDERFWVWVEKSKDNNYIFYGSASKNTSEMGYLRLGVDNAFKTVIKRENNVEYYIDIIDNNIFILTNKDAYNFKIMKYNIKENTMEEFIKESDNTLLYFDVFENFLIVFERKDGLPAIHVFNLYKKTDYYIEFPEPSYSLWLGQNKIFDTDTLRFNYSSFITPTTVYDYNMRTRKFIIKKQREVLGDYNKNDYTVERIFVKARDGIEVPLSIVYKKDIDIKQDNYFILDGYGAYGSANDPYFSSLRLSLLNRGIVIGVAHIRGGGEKGKWWYDNGRLLNKKNTFFDFIDISKFLINNNYTSAEKLIIRGGSAGGLLIGATINYTPELFKAAVLSVPFVDVMNTMLDSTLPLTIPEYEEWGNPYNEEYFDYILSYSPYDNIKKQCYPDILIMSSFNDSRVAFWEPLKYIAKLREYNTCSSLLLLKMNMNAGHGGVSGRYDFYRDVAFEYAFILHEFNLK